MEHNCANIGREAPPLLTLPRPSLVVLLMSALLTPDKIRILFFPTRQRLNFTGLGAGRAQLVLAQTKVFTVPGDGEIEMQPQRSKGMSGLLSLA